MNSTVFRATNLGLSLILVVNSTGCATVTKGSYQQISIVSNPGNALVKVDGIDKGETPIVIKMKRSKSHTVQLNKEGFQVYEAGIKSVGSAAIWGNILLGGIVGLIVDLISGASHNLEPGSIDAQLDPV